MTDSGNSGFGGRADDVQTTGPSVLGECPRCCGRPCKCLRWLAAAVTDWTGAEPGYAAQLAEDVWRKTAGARPGQGADVIPLARECSFCGQPVYKAPDGQIRTAKPGPNLELADDPVCPNSPNEHHTHGMP